MKSRTSFNILYFLVIYGFLTVAFNGFIGITSPGGNTYIPWLDHYCNVPAWLTWVIAKFALKLLYLLGFAAAQHAPNNVYIAGSHGVTILWACLGFGVMSFWAAFVMAHRATVQFKLKWTALGICLITILNITRITLIAVANQYRWKALQAIEPHRAFNIASYIVIVGLLVWFVKQYKRYNQSLPALQVPVKEQATNASL